MEVDQHKRQLLLEQEALGLGAMRYRKTVPMPWREESSKLSELTELPPGKELIRRALPILAGALLDTFERAQGGKAGRHHSAVPMIITIDPEVLAYITSRLAMNSLSKPVPLQTLMTSVGQAVSDHLQFADLAREEPALFAHMNKKLSKTTTGARRATIMRHAIKYGEIQSTDWNSREKFRVGEKLITMFAEHAGLMTIETSRIGKRSTTRLVATERTQRWLEKAHARCELLAPLTMPMVCKPKPWKNPIDGGYLTIRKFLVKTSNAGYRDDLFNTDMPDVYQAINVIQDVAWSINNSVLDVMRDVWDSGGCIGGLPKRENYPIPAQPWGANEEPHPDVLTAWKGRAAAMYETNAKLESKRMDTSQKLWLAEKFADEEAIYFPHSLDFRGRVYPMPSGLNPQSDDAGKALLQFANGKPLGQHGAFWLAVHIANLFGVDKVSLDERVQWVHDNERDILESAMMPLDGARFWTTADKPYSALAACFEWAGYKMEGEAFVSHLPIALDGSCSGLQHFSAMLRDEVGGEAVNLTVSDQPSDIYTQIATRVEEMLESESDPFADVWKGKVSRKMVKQPAMTFAYSATRFGMAGQIKEALRKADSESGSPYLDGADNYAASNYLSALVFKAICGTVVAAATAMAWLKAVAKVASQDQLPIRWTTPMGLPVLQDYRKFASARHNVFFQGKRIRLSLRHETSKLDSVGQGNGIAPNFVHSLDSSHLQSVMLCARAEGIESVALVHDSFGTHAADTDMLSMILRETFVQQYSGDVLHDFMMEIREQLPDELIEELPEMPIKGSLDLSGVRDSDFCFA